MRKFQLKSMVTLHKKMRLKIKKWCISNKLSDEPPVNAIGKYENHPSITKIKPFVEIT